MPRKKHFVMDELDLPYSPLTCDQTENIRSRKRPAEDAPQEEKNKFYRTWNLDVIRMGLNNAAGTDEFKPETEWAWTNTRILRELDLVVYEKIEDEILEMSGMVSKEVKEGESKAATSN